jgi:hypothetical protein
MYLQSTLTGGHEQSYGFGHIFRSEIKYQSHRLLTCHRSWATLPLTAQRDPHTHQWSVTLTTTANDMETLPPPVLLGIITFIDTATLHNLHLTSCALHNLLATHMPPQKLQRSDVMRLAAETMLPPFLTYGVDDPIADEHRGYIQKGLAILWAFADIADTCPIEDSEEGQAGFCGLRSRKTTVLRRHEEALLSKRLEYVQKNLTAEDLFHYEIMCTAAFERFYDGPRRIAEQDHVSGNKYGVARKNARMNWYLLRYGPPVLLNLWSTDLGKYTPTVRGINEAFQQKSAVKIERKAARDLHVELKNINPSAHQESSDYRWALFIRFRARRDEPVKTGQEAQYQLR